jgi:hypothetical protein
MEREARKQYHEIFIDDIGFYVRRGRFYEWLVVEN